VIEQNKFYRLIPQLKYKLTKKNEKWLKNLNSRLWEKGKIIFSTSHLDLQIIISLCYLKVVEYKLHTLYCSILNTQWVLQKNLRKCSQINWFDSIDLINWNNLKDCTRSRCARGRSLYGLTWRELRCPNIFFWRQALFSFFKSIRVRITSRNQSFIESWIKDEMYLLKLTMIRYLIWDKVEF
jgi:hypothetical protein